MSRFHGSDRTGARLTAGELLDQLREGIPRAYLDRLAAQSPINGVVTVTVALLIGAFLLSHGYSTAAVAWTAAQVVVAGTMLARWMRHRHRETGFAGGRTRRGLYHGLLWAAVSGSLWGTLTAFLPGAPAHVQIVLILTMGGMAAGASATLAAVPQIAAVYILGCTIPATAYHLSLGGEIGGTLALVFAVFTVAMIAMSQVVFTALSRQFDAERHAQELARIGAALRESEQRFRLTFENAAVGIAHVGPDGTWLRVNDRVCEIVGYGRDELMSRTFQDITHPGDLAADLARFESMLRGELSGYQIEKRYLHKRGHAIWVHLTVALERGEQGEPMYCITVIQDITDRKAAEAALRESDRAKDEFLAVLGHELRNPLAPLRTGLNVLERSPRDFELLDRVLPMMDRQLSHLVRLVDDLLDIARISRGAIELQQAPVEVESPLRAALEQTGTLLEQRQHRLLVEPMDRELRVHGDFERLTQVFANLVDNAAKYMEPGGTIHVSASLESGQAVVRVRDQGRGIPPDRLDSVFTLFSRGEANGSGGGLGIGLALSRRLVEMHGGSIEAHSAGPGCGSEFVVRLPVAGAALP